MLRPLLSLTPRTRSVVLLLAVLVGGSGCAAELDEPPVVALDLGGAQRLDRGQEREVTATVRYEDGSAALAGPDPELQVATDDPAVARIDARGRLVGVAVGVTGLRATYRGAEAVTRVVVAR